MSADAGYNGGEFTTPGLVHAGRTLTLNCDGSAGGWIKVEIQDENGTPLLGLSLTDADVLRGNGLSKVVTWNGGSNVQQTAGRPVKLRFVMRDCKLYAMQFT